jgi:hypothetical protein
VNDRKRTKLENKNKKKRVVKENERMGNKKKIEL